MNYQEMLAKELEAIEISHYRALIATAREAVLEVEKTLIGKLYEISGRNAGANQSDAMAKYLLSIALTGDSVKNTLDKADSGFRYNFVSHLARRVFSQASDNEREIS
jgi:hypothetical protein